MRLVPSSEEFLRYEIGELATERVRFAIGIYLTLQQKKMKLLGFKAVGPSLKKEGLRICHIHFDKREVLIMTKREFEKYLEREMGIQE